MHQQQQMRQQQQQQQRQQQQQQQHKQQQHKQALANAKEVSASIEGRDVQNDKERASSTTRAGSGEEDDMEATRRATRAMVDVLSQNTDPRLRRVNFWIL